MQAGFVRGSMSRRLQRNRSTRFQLTCDPMLADRYLVRTLPAYCSAQRQCLTKISGHRYAPARLDQRAYSNATVATTPPVMAIACPRARSRGAATEHSNQSDVAAHQES